MISPNFMLGGFEALLAILIAGSLLSSASLAVPKWHRLLIAIASASLFAQTAFIFAEHIERNLNAHLLVDYVNDVCIAALTLTTLAALITGRRTSTARISHTSPPSGPHPTV